MSKRIVLVSLLDKAGFEDECGFSFFALDLFNVVGETDIFEDRSDLEGCRRSLEFEILDHGYRVAVLEDCSVAVFRFFDEIVHNLRVIYIRE